MNINGGKYFKVALSDLNKVLGLTLIIIFFVSGFFVLAEPQLSIAATTATSNVVVTLSVGEGISLSVDNGTTAMTPISMTQDTGVATSTFTVATNAVGGYKLELNATATPAMAAGSVVIPDATVTPTLIASIPASGTYAFGFSAYGANVPTGTWGTTSTGCAEGASSTPSASLKWRGFAGATKVQIATQTSTTTTAGVPSTVCFFAKQNGSYIPTGSYQATVVATATTL